MENEYSLGFFYKLKMDGDMAVLDWCMRVGLIADRYECPECVKPMRLYARKKSNDGYAWGCRRTGVHEIWRSVRNGSWFSKSKLSISVIMLLTCLWMKKVTHDFIKKELRMSSKIVVDWTNFCREVCVDICLRENGKIGGVGKIVEIDQFKVGKRKNNKGKRVKGKCVFGGVERGSNICFFKVVKTMSAKILLKVLKKNVHLGTTIISNCLKEYNCLEDKGFKHLSVNRSLHFKDPDTGAHTNTIGSTWGSIKRALGARHINGMLDGYLAEFMWRRKVGKDPAEAFRSFIEGIKTLYTPHTQDPDDYIEPKPSTSKLVKKTEQNYISPVKSTAQKCVLTQAKSDAVSSIDNLVNFGASTSDCKWSAGIIKSQVTSPKLSLKRNRVEISPKTSKEESEEKIKRLKADDSSTFSNINSNGHFLNSTSYNEETCSSSPLLSAHKNSLKFKELLEFCKPLMEASEAEKTQIVDNMTRLLNAAQSTYVSSREFSVLINLTKQNIVNETSKHFIHLNNLCSELKAYKLKKKFKKEPKDNVCKVTNETKISIKDDVTAQCTIKNEETIITNDSRMETTENSKLPELKILAKDFPLSSGTSIMSKIELNGLCAGTSQSKTEILPEVKACSSAVSSFTSHSHKDDALSNKQSSNEQRRNIQIEKLEKLLGDLDKKIKKLQQKELTLDDLDNEDSSYIQEDRYQKRFNRVWTVLCQLKKRSVLSGRKLEKRFIYEGTRFKCVNKSIEKLINRRKPCEKFPDYFEVHDLLDKVNKEEDIGLDQASLSRLAKSVFEDVGLELKHRRHLDHEEIINAYLPDNTSVDDPAEHDEELRKKLDESIQIGEKRIDEILSEYVEKQTSRNPEENTDNSSCSEDTVGAINKISAEDDDSAETEPRTPERTVGDSQSGAAIKRTESPKSSSGDSVIALGYDSDASTKSGYGVTKNQNCEKDTKIQTKNLADYPKIVCLFDGDSKSSSSSGLLSDIENIS